MTDGPQKQDPNTVKALFAALALGSVLAGFMIYLLQEQLGIPSDTARFVTTVFVVLGVADALVLYVWDRYSKK
jgi:hypothetical protein